MGDMSCVLYGLQYLLFADAQVENSAIIFSFIEAIHDFVALFSLRFVPVVRQSMVSILTLGVAVHTFQVCQISIP